MRISLPIPFEAVTTHTAEEAFERVLNYAGASLYRDVLDEAIVNDTRNGEATYTGKDCKRGIINSQDDLKPEGAGDEWSAWPELKSKAAPSDTDGDGIPDDWEIQQGLDPNNPEDGKTTGDQYTNLEIYLNELVEKITMDQMAGGVVLSGQQTTGIIVPFRPEIFPTNNRIYTLNGSQAGANYKGIVIVNGQKRIQK
jgi:hypothetical protein